MNRLHGRILALLLVVVMVMASIPITQAGALMQQQMAISWSSPTGATIRTADSATITLIHTGTVGIGGAPWRLYSDGTLVVEEGQIWTTSTHSLSPWYSYRNIITRIVFTGTITSGQWQTMMNGLFRDLHNLTTIEGLEHFDTSRVTNMGGMFAGASSLERLDLSHWDTSSVTTIGSMFSGASSLVCLNVSGWDTSNVGVMGNVFSNASSLMSIDLTSWDTSRATDMGGMFFGTRDLVRIDGISDWNTGNVISMASMFHNASSLKSLDLSNWDTGNVTDMGSMFRGASSLESLDLSNWDTSNLITTSILFNGVANMFRYASSLTSLDLSGWDISGIYSTMSMFSHTASLTNLNLSGWDTSNITHMDAMFSSTGLVSLDISGWNTSNVRYMNGMFRNAVNLESLNLSGWDVRGTNLDNFLYGASGLQNLNLSGWEVGVEVGNRTVMDSTFRDTSSLRWLVLGEHFSFWGGVQGLPALPSVPNNDIYTGFWQNIGAGTVNNPLGEHIFTSAELMANFNGVTMADTWVWQPRNPIVIPTVTNIIITPDTTSIQRGTTRQISAVVQGTNNPPQDVIWTVIGNNATETSINAGGLLTIAFDETAPALFVRAASLHTPTVYREVTLRVVTQNGTLGAGGAPWRLYSDGVLVVDSGNIFHDSLVSPWFAHRDYINKIVFSGEMIGLSMVALFRELSYLTVIEGLNNIDTSNIFAMNSMFSGARSLTSLDLSSWDTSNVRDMGYMFWMASSLTNLNLSGWDTGNVTRMSHMFFGASELTGLDISDWDTSSVTDMWAMFQHTWSLRDVDLSNWNVGNVTDMRFMFHASSALAQNSDLSRWDTSNVRNMADMFFVARLTELNVSSWNVSNVTNMRFMFGGTSLTSLDLSGWDTSNVGNMEHMFSGNIRQLTLSEQFRFTGNSSLFVPNDGNYTGFWQNVGLGTVSNPQGVRVYTSEQLWQNFNSNPTNDTWVWQPIKSTQLPLAPDGVSISPATVSIRVGATRQLTYMTTPDGSESTTVYWASNNPAVATVNGSGLVTAVAVGTAEIEVIVNGNYTATATVSVTAAQQVGPGSGGGSPSAQATPSSPVAEPEEAKESGYLHEEYLEVKPAPPEEVRAAEQAVLAAADQASQTSGVVITIVSDAVVASISEPNTIATLIMPEDSNTAAITTMAILNPDGSLTPIPTRINAEGNVVILLREDAVLVPLNVQANFIDIAELVPHVIFEINRAASMMIIEGRGNGIFDPTAGVTTQEAALMFLRALGHPVSYATAMTLAAELGLIAGNLNGNLPMSRVATARLISGALESIGIKPSITLEEAAVILAGFVDLGELSADETVAMAVAVQLEIFRGAGGGLMNPTDILERSQMASLAVRLIDVILS